ncbi:MAG: hypothetical protein H6982_16875 [Chromatiales bacterium]|nr:hypothetical protein [Chromatiales bacterium]
MIADGYLAAVAVEHRQRILDELAGRVRAGISGARPVYDPLRFVKGLCDAANAGAFVPNLGVAITGARLHERRRAAIAAQAAETAIRNGELPPPDPSHPLVQRMNAIRERQRARRAEREAAAAAASESNPPLEPPLPQI